MSELFEKLQPRERVMSGAARAKLKHLRERWGLLAEEADGHIRITSMGRIEVWKHVSGRGPDAIYERANEPNEGEAHGEG